MKRAVLSFLYKLWGWLPLPFSLRWPILWLGLQKFLIGVAAVIFNERGEILLFKHTYREIPWGLPGGWLEANEDPARAVEREVREESGLEVQILTPVWIRSGPNYARVDIIYYGRMLGGSFRPSPEVCEAVFFPPDGFPVMSEDTREIVALAIAARERGEEDRTRINAEKRG